MSSFKRLATLAVTALVAPPLAAAAHPRYAVTPVGVAGSVANDINSSGAVVGNFPFNASSTHGFSNIGGVITDLGTLGGPDSYAAALNDSDVIVGTAINPDGYRRAFRYEGGTMVDLGRLAATTAARPASTTAATSPVRPISAFVYSHGKMRDLTKQLVPGSGWEVITAAAINNSGQIAATGCRGGVCQAIRLDPVP